MRLLRRLAPLALLLIATPAWAQWSSADPIVVSSYGSPVGVVAQKDGQPVGGLWFDAPSETSYPNICCFQKLNADGTLGPRTTAYTRGLPGDESDRLDMRSDEAGGLWVLWRELAPPEHIRLNRMDADGNWMFDGNGDGDKRDGVLVPVVSESWRYSRAPQGTFYDQLRDDAWQLNHEKHYLIPDGTGGVWLAWSDSIDSAHPYSTEFGTTKFQHYDAAGHAQFDSTGRALLGKAFVSTITSDGDGGLLTYSYILAQRNWTVQHLLEDGQIAWLTASAPLPYPPLAANRSVGASTYFGWDRSEISGFNTAGRLEWHRPWSDSASTATVWQFVEGGDLYLALDDRPLDGGPGTRAMLAQRVTSAGEVPWGERPMLLAKDDTTAGDFRITHVAGSRHQPGIPGAGEGGIVALYRAHQPGIPVDYSEAAIIGPRLYLARARRDGGGFSGLPGEPHRVLVCDSTNVAGQGQVYDDGYGWIVLWYAGPTVATPGGLLAQRVSPSGLVGRMGVVGVADRVLARPDLLRLIGASPNPFNPTTTVRYELATAGKVRLEVFDALGRRVRTLVDETKLAGSHTATFDGAGLATGVYLVRLTAAGNTAVQRVTLVR